MPRNGHGFYPVATVVAGNAMVPVWNGPGQQPIHPVAPPPKGLSLANCWDELTDMEKGYLLGVRPSLTLATLPFFSIMEAWASIHHRAGLNDSALALSKKLDKYITKEQMDCYQGSNGSPSAGPPVPSSMYSVPLSDLDEYTGWVEHRRMAMLICWAVLAVVTLAVGLWSIFGSFK